MSRGIEIARDAIHEGMTEVELANAIDHAISEAIQSADQPVDCAQCEGSGVVYHYEAGSKCGGHECSCKAVTPKRESSDERERQGGFICGDVVEYVGMYKDDVGWKGETFIICEVRFRQHGVEFTIREKTENRHGEWQGLVDGLCVSDLRLVTNQIEDGS